MCPQMVMICSCAVEMQKNIGNIKDQVVSQAGKLYGDHTIRTYFIGKN